MTFTGTIQDGALVFTTPVAIPPGTEVRVETAQVAEDPTPVEQRKLNFAERYAFFIGKMEGLPEDASINVDHYLYGHPKRT